MPVDYKEDDEPKEEELSQEDIASIIKDEIGDALKDIQINKPVHKKRIIKKIVKPAEVTPVAPQEVKETPKEEPKVETPVVKEEPVKVTPKPVVRNEVRGSETNVEKGEIIKLNFKEKIANGSKDLITNYNYIKNLIMSFGLKDRVSSTADTFRLHKKTYAKITTNGDALKLFLALDPKDFQNTALPIYDMTGKSAYEDIRVGIKVKSELSARRAIELIYACMRQNNLEQVEELGTVDYVAQIRQELRNK